MKYLRIVTIVLLFCVFVDNSAFAQVPTPPTNPQPSTQSLNAIPIEYNTLYASANTDLWKINPYVNPPGTFTYIGPIGYQGTDIAFDGKTLYGASFSQLLRIDPTTGHGTVIGNFHEGLTYYSDVNALTVGPDGAMYAGTVSGKLLRIWNKDTGEAFLIGNYGPLLGSSGDLAIQYDNKMFASVKRLGYSTDWLVEINKNNGTATTIGEIGYYNVFGLDFKDWSLYGVTDSGQLLQIDTKTGRGSLIKTSTSTPFWGLSTSGPALTGKITSPPDNYDTGPASIQITATAVYTGGIVNQVEFYVMYDGIWHSLGLGSQSGDIYTNGWKTPLNLNSQIASLRIDVVGTDQQNKTQRASDAGGVRHVNFSQSIGDPSIIEKWVPNRAYLNQRSLLPYVDGNNNSYPGDWQCNVSSIAMILAMDGYIYKDYLTMANKAHDLAHYVFPNPDVGKECTALFDNGAVPNAYCSGDITNKTDAWSTIKNLIDAHHPVIIDTHAATSEGHYIAVVGYKEAAGKHDIIAYDPYGQWRGSLDAYYRNATDPPSHVGKWVYYDFEEFTSDHVYLFATVSPTSFSTDSLVKPAAPTTPPDQVSDEPRIPVIFTGQETFYLQYFPILIR